MENETYLDIKLLEKIMDLQKSENNKYLYYVQDNNFDLQQMTRKEREFTSLKNSDTIVVHKIGERRFRYYKKDSMMLNTKTDCRNLEPCIFLEEV